MRLSIKDCRLRMVVGLVVLLTSPAVAQELMEPTKPPRRRREVDLHYNFALIGHNLSLHYNHFFGRHAFTVGTKFHLQTQINRDNSRLYGWTFYKPFENNPWGARGFYRPLTNRLGLDLGYKYTLIRSPKATWLNPYAFYQLQSTISMPARTTAYGGGYTTSSWTVFENAVGVGVQPKLDNRWYLNGSIGLGAAYFIDEAGTFVRASDPTINFWETGPMIRLGVTYRLSGPK